MSIPAPDQYSKDKSQLLQVWLLLITNDQYTNSIPLLPSDADDCQKIGAGTAILCKMKADGLPENPPFSDNLRLLVGSTVVQPDPGNSTAPNIPDALSVARAIYRSSAIVTGFWTGGAPHPRGVDMPVYFK